MSDKYYAVGGRTAGVIAWWRRLRGACPVTGMKPCPWHPGGGNHPVVGAPHA